MQQYHKLLQDILETGTHKDAARENMPGTTSLFGYQMKFDLAEGFPLLTTKKVSLKNIAVELIWFLKGDSNIKFLVDNGVHIWNDDYQNWVNKNNWVEEGNVGYQYPSLWRAWGKVDVRWQPKPQFKDTYFYPLIESDIKSTSKYVGKTFTTNQGYQIKVISFNGLQEYTVQFLHTGYISKTNGLQGFNRISYPYHLTGAGISCIGIDDHTVSTEIRNKLRNVWKGMISRCYDSSHIEYERYGGRGVYVDNRWLCFEFYLKDIMNLPNWDLKLNNWTKYQLDKDAAGGLLYSKDTCIWLTAIQNSSSRHGSIFYHFKNKYTNEIFITNCFADLVKKGVSRSNISASGTSLKKGKIKSMSGWQLIKTQDRTYQGVDQIAELIKGLKSNPLSRRHIISAWNPTTLDQMALNACHCFVQFNCRPLTKAQRLKLYNPNFELAGFDSDQKYDEIVNFINHNNVPKYYLDCSMYQRSCDIFLGAPYNIASYALFTEMLCKATNIIPGIFTHSLGDVHVYDDHLDQTKEILTRTPKQLPTLELPNDHNWEEAILSGNIDWKIITDSLKNYNPDKAIKAELSTGLKK